MGLEKTVAKKQPTRDRRISRKSRNKLLLIAFVLLGLDMLLAVVFMLLAPTDPRLNDVFASRRQLRTVYVQGVVAVLDAAVSIGVVVHVISRRSLS